jgi:acetaldehyde dehydrogenase/alcohol dehydrogenase
MSAKPTNGSEQDSAEASARTMADDLLQKACMAAAVFQQYDQAQTDRIVAQVCRAGFDQRVALAKMACAETGLGVWEHKVIKNVIATQFIQESILHEKTVGVLSVDEVSGITEIAQPLGPVLAIIPMTNPTSTVMFKILLCLKTRNPILISPTRKAVKCCAETARICYEAALAAGAPEDCIQCLPEVSRDLTHAVMSHRQLALILATGGTGLVGAAYSSGTPAIGVGPGNVPVLIDVSADVPFAVENILLSKTFDNGTICASEQAIVVEQALSPLVRAEFERQRCYFLTPGETVRVQAVAVLPDTGAMNPAVVGQSAMKIAEMAGIAPPNGTRILLAKLDGVGKDCPLSGEVLAPILAYYEAADFDAAIKRCIDLNYLGGIGHTAAIYANDEQRIALFSDLMNAGRVLVNTPSSHGGVGGTYNTLTPSFTLGCGAGGKNITTENVSARHLINIKRCCRRRTNERLARFDTALYLDEKLHMDAILRSYNQNY